MSDKKTLLEEGTVRRFMKLANMEAIGSGFVNEMYTSPMADDEDLEEGRKKKKGLREDETLEETTEEINEEETDLEERASAPMADDDMPEEMEVADLEIEDEEGEAEEPKEEMDMDAGDMGELTLTDEEAEVFLKVADKVRAAMEMDAPEELPAPDMGDEEDMSVEMDAEMDMEPADEVEEEPMMEDMVNEVARRVARRLNEMKKSK